MLDKLKFVLSHQYRTILVAIVLVISGASTVGIGLANQIEAPMPALAGLNDSVDPQSTTVSENYSLPASEPVQLSIPSIDVDSSLIQVGKNPDGTLEVPAGDNYHKPAWYKYSATPGQIGPTIIEGHIDSVEDGPSVFFNLGKLKPKDRVLVEREDGTTAVFEIEEVALYNKDDFPTEKVYGITNNPTIRLITCGGNLNRDAGEYDSNIIAFGSLVQPNIKE